MLAGWHCCSLHTCVAAVLPVLQLSWDGPPSASHPPLRTRGLAGASSLGREE